VNADSLSKRMFRGINRLADRCFLSFVLIFRFGFLVVFLTYSQIEDPVVGGSGMDGVAMALKLSCGARFAG
jgi:hypothetical protein